MIRRSRECRMQHDIISFSAVECICIESRHYGSMRTCVVHRDQASWYVNLGAFTQTTVTTCQPFGMQLRNSTNVCSVVQPGDAACRHSCCERTPTD